MQLFSNSLLAHWMRSTKAIPLHLHTIWVAPHTTSFTSGVKVHIRQSSTRCTTFGVSGYASQRNGMGCISLIFFAPTVHLKWCGECNCTTLQLADVHLYTGGERSGMGCNPNVVPSKGCFRCIVHCVKKMHPPHHLGAPPVFFCIQRSRLSSLRSDNPCTLRLPPLR